VNARDSIRKALSQSCESTRGMIPQPVHFVILADHVKYSKNRAEYFFMGEMIGVIENGIEVKI
jgi:hypothetical protein